MKMVSEHLNLNSNPSENANGFNKLFYWWLRSICYKGATRDLESKDLYAPVYSERSEVLGDQLEREWKKELAKMEISEDVGKKYKRNYKPSLLRCIVRIHLWSFLFQGVLMFVQNIVCLNLRTIFLGWLITYFDPGSTITKTNAYWCAFGVVGMTAISVLAGNQARYETSRIGMKIRVACSSLVYRKILKLNKTSLDRTAGGQILNLLSNDVQKFDAFPVYLHHLWITPIQIILVCYLVWQDVGPAVFAGIVACTLQTFPVHIYISKLSVQLRRKIAKQTDKRVQFMNEMISGIQVVKMYGWEKPFERIINRVRMVEMKLVSMACHCRGFYMNGLVFTDRVTVFATLLTLVSTGNDINAEMIFTMMAYWRTLVNFMADQFPYAVVSAGDAHVSFQRLEAYLHLEEQTLRDKDALANVHPPNEKTIVNISKLSANWIHDSLPPTLCDLNLKVHQGELCVLVGPVGSGKSSILQLILREIPVSNGILNVGGKTVSYAAQQTWIFGGTIRDNILFGLPYVKEKYDEVIKVCALIKDLQQLPQGHLTPVADRGDSLSGGQRARINLARAVYRDADVYLLDDPLSAVDARVGRQLFDQCINGYLQGKTRILATHQLQYLKNCDTIVILKDGSVQSQGTFETLVSNDPEFASLVNNFDVVEGDPKANVRRAQSSARQLKRGISSATESKNIKPETSEKEEVAKGQMSFEVYKQYFAAGGNLWLRVSVLLMIILAQVATSGVDYWVSWWANHETFKATLDSSDVPTNLSRFDDDEVDWRPLNSSDISKHPGTLLSMTTSLVIYTVLLSCCIAFTLVRGTLLLRLCVNASRTLHDRMFKNILQATMQFFSTNPSGRILNRFSKDIGAMDEMLPRSMLEVITVVCITMGYLAMIVISNYWLLIPTVIFGGICLAARNAYLSIAQCISRLEGVGKSPVLSHVNYSLDGLLTIRSSRAQQKMMKEFDDLQNLHTSATSINISITHAFTLYLNAIVTVLITVVCFIFLILDDENTMSGNVGLAVTQSIGLTESIQYGIRKSVQMVGELISTERVLQYTNLPKEGPFTSNIANRPPPTWPHRGEIDIQNLNLKYIEDKPAVLKNINVHISHGQKIGIVGRTGAGKSSLIAALFRLAKLEGTLKIDGIDIQMIGLHDLRSKISIIPQEPTLFKATLRYNLDPFDEFSDAYLWSALDEVGLRNCFGSLDHKINDGGSNLSLGERQLVCLARAILKNNKIVVLDEATANVDPGTDALIQDTIRRKFADYTVLTIAHRLSTIIDNNRVLVLEAGSAVEFDHPYKLLLNPNGHFTRMVGETGYAMASQLTNAACAAYDSRKSSRNY